MPRGAQYVAAAAVLGVLAAVNLRGWLLQDLVPPQDFAGYAAVAEYVRESVLRHGYVPAWNGKWFAGTTNFLSHLKEYVALPFLLLAGPIRGLESAIVFAKAAAALAFYAIFVHEFRTPLAGLVAAYAYAFSHCANHATQRLDVALSAVLFPLVLLAALKLAQWRRPAAAVILGVLLACQLDVNYMQASVCLGMLLVLLALRPFGAEPLPPRDGAGGRARAGLLLAAALGAFLVVGGSQLAWLATDMPNHAFFSPSQLAFTQVRYSEFSPFVFLNRDHFSGTGSWIAAHLPPGADRYARLDERYLGLTVALVCIAGWFTLRRRPVLRRWYQFGIIVMLAQYWVSMGPRTLVWDVVTSLRGSDVLTRVLERSASVLGVLAVARGVFVLVRARSSDDVRVRHRGETWFGAGMLLVLASHSLFAVLAAIIPGVGGIRSPGKFFDLVPFSASLVFGVSLVGLQSRLPEPRRRVVAVAVGLLVVVDFWPSTRRFYEGTPPSRLAPLDAALRPLPGEDGTLRVLPVSSWGWLVAGPTVSLLLTESEAGGVRSWLPWQAGRHWPDFVSTDLRPRRAPQCLPWRPEVSCGFLALARVKYVLQTPPGGPLGPPWTLSAESDLFTLWERPDVMPMAYGTRGYVLSGGPSESMAAVDEALAHHLIVVSGAVDDRWKGLQRAADRPLLTVRYTRPGPGEITLETDAGDAPAVVHVAESYHPGWTARVDGRVSTVLRAQGTFMAVVIDAGAHRIDLRFEPPPVVRFADGMTAVAWGFLGLAALGWIAATAWSTARRIGRFSLQERSVP
jgi:hypothetical protein